MKKTFYLFVTILMLSSITSCKKYFDVQPEGQVSEQNFYKNINDLQVGLYAAYSVLKERTFQQTLALLGDGISDDFLYQLMYSGTFAVDGYKLERFQTTADNVWILNWYAENYKGIYRVNQVIRHMDDSIPITYSKTMDNIKLWQHIYGQLLFLRAYYYFNLVKAFGGVPIQPVTPVINHTTFPRATKDSVYAYIEKDIRLAALLLAKAPGLNPQSQATTVPLNDPMHYNEPCKFSALAFLTKVLIYESTPEVLSDKWLEAKKIGDCLFYGQSNQPSQVLSNDDVLKLSVNFNGYTWNQLLHKYKFDVILNSVDSTDADFVGFKQANGILAGSNFSNSKKYFDWPRMWRIKYQNSTDNTSVLFCAPAMSSTIFDPNSYVVTTYIDAIYGVTRNWPYALDPTSSLYTEMHLESGDPRNLYGVLPQTPAGNLFPLDMPASQVFAGTGVTAENFKIFIKRWLWDDGSELGSSYDASPRNLVLMRYNEFVLFYAEALNESGFQTDAMKVLNNFRKNVANGFTNYGYTVSGFNINLVDGPYNYVRDLIWHERRVELCGEFDRFWDIVRQNRAAELMNLQPDASASDKANLVFVRGKHELLPIPESEIELSNNVVTQNPGY